MRLTESGKQKLLVVKEQILNNSQLFDMREFSLVKDCGTVCCICGQLNWNEGKREKDELWNEANAVNLLTEEFLDESDEFDNSLFFVSDWPDEFKDRYKIVEEEPQLRAKVAAEYIDYVVANGGW